MRKINKNKKITLHYQSLDLLLEGIAQLDPEEKNMVKAMIEGVILKHQAKQLIKTA